jgi:hypothetical protein
MMMKNTTDSLGKKLKLGMFFAALMAMMAVESVFFHAWSRMARAVFFRGK